MHTPGKGISSSALPYSRRAPSWLKTAPSEVVEQIHKLARRGMTPSQIGVTLRDSHGIPQVRFVTGNKILRILKSHGASSYTLFLSDLLTFSFFSLPSVYAAFVGCFFAFLFGDRIGTVHPRGPLAPRQKGGRRAKAPRDQQEGQGLEIPSHSHRVPYPSSRTLL